MKAFKDSLFVDKMRKVVPISDNAVAQLADYLEECHFSKRDMILEVGKYCHYAWLIEKGFVRHYWQRGGNDTVTSFSIEGHVVFSMDEFYYQKPSEECAQAMEDIDAWRINLHDFERLFRKNHELCNWGRVIHQNEYRRLHHSHMERLTLTAEQRYERFCADFPEVCRRATLRDVASYLGVNQSTLSRIRAKIF